MDLILSVLADPKGANMLKHTKLFTVAGGSLGRADGNDWVLPDPERVVSSKHALITFAGNQYFLTDNSTNGTFHNNSADPLGKGNQVALNDGDIIGVGDYRLKVTLRQPRAESGLPKGLGDADFLDGSDRTTFNPAAAAKMQNQAEAQQLDSWLEPGQGNAASQSGEWGFIGTAVQNEANADSLIAPETETVDPLAAFTSTASSNSAVDPMSSFASGAQVRQGGSEWDDDDWWKDGSDQDHAPADRHAMQFTVQSTVAPAVEPERPNPPAVQQPLEAQSTVDNPFADSLAVMDGQQISGAPGFGAEFTTGAGSSNASQQFSQLPPASLSEPSPRQAPPPNPAAVAQQPPQPMQNNDGNALAAELGLSLTPQQLQQLDHQACAIVQETVARLIDLLRARSSIKNELRVQRTMIQTEANNPLKFSATAADALRAMFAGNGAFMSPEHAVRDSFDDLSDHQVAVLAGMRAGYDAMLKYFNPENIQRRLNSQSGVFTSKNAKSWEGFEAMYRELLRDPEDCYRRLFGDEFATTYEHQLSELKNARNLKS